MTAYVDLVAPETAVGPHSNGNGARFASALDRAQCGATIDSAASGHRLPEKHGAEDAQRRHRADVLRRLFESEILPKLAIARAPADRGKAASETPSATTGSHANELVHLVLAEDGAAGMHYVDELRGSGVTVRSLLLGLLTDSARLLGEFWLQDRCSFVDVTVSLGRLQQIVRRLAPLLQPMATHHAHARSALLLPAPGEQHTFGLVILAEFFRNEGWLVVGGPATSGEEAIATVRNSWFDIAGFSIGSELGIDRLRRTIALVRQASCNRGVAVMVGGPLAQSSPDLARRVGADFCATDAPSALCGAHALLRLQMAGVG